MIKNHKLVIEYDGTPFSGWQRQTDRITVQGQLEKVLSKILNQKISIHGSGRTDAGVHAQGQVASFKADTQIHSDEIKTAVNRMIKYPIVIKECCTIDPDFHAQYSALSKEYHYYILNRTDPMAIGRQYHWHIRQPLDFDCMQQCCKKLVGTFDFKSFENTGSPRTSTVREILTAGFIRPEKGILRFEISASGFLKYMVRNIVGTLVMAGKGQIDVSDMETILISRDRKNAGPTAPPHGLFLVQVNYS